ncbi:MAG: c-type cytochrome [Candidatus Binatia bacterium]|nr:c-type cytochrome [Candidatus Binatia bacterium]
MRALALAVGLTLLLPVAAARADDDGAEAVEALCAVCHRADLIHQQRLDEKQWRATVDKMVSWGAQADDDDLKDMLVAYLWANYGPDAGPFVAKRVAPNVARAELLPLPDGPFAGGNAERGKALYDSDCAGCHAASARGDLGLNLVDMYFLYRAPDFAQIVRGGRGEMMPGRPMDDAGVGDLLAYLRRFPGASE